MLDSNSFDALNASGALPLGLPRGVALGPHRGSAVVPLTPRLQGSASRSCGVLGAVWYTPPGFPLLSDIKSGP